MKKTFRAVPLIISILLVVICTFLSQASDAASSDTGAGSSPEQLASNVSMAGASINSLGEVVWSQQDSSNYTQIFSTARGQLTSNPASHRWPAANNLGDLVWVEYIIKTEPFTGTQQKFYVLKGIIAGQSLTLASSQKWIGNTDINDRGEVVWSQLDSSDINQIYSNLRGQLTTGTTRSLDQRINNQGDVVFVSNDSTTPGMGNIFKIPSGSTTPVAVTSDNIERCTPSINDNGEIVWVERISTFDTQVVSNVRGVLIPPANRILSVDLNNCGDVVYVTNVNSQYNLYRLVSNSACKTYPGVKETITMALSASVRTSMYGTPVTFTATISDNVNIPAGTVTFRDGADTIGTGTIDSTNKATFTTTSLTVGSHSITATYSANDSLPVFTSAPLTQSVVITLPLTAATEFASSVGITTATLNATVSDGGADTTVSFEYGFDTSYGDIVTAGTVMAGTGSTPVSASISSLICGATYHYRVVATNSVGTTYGNDSNFSTYPCQMAPNVSTSTASAISTTGATLNGYAYPGAAVTTVTFDYGQTSDYGSTVTASQSPLAENGGGAVSAAVTGLTCGTTYHFRINGQNSISITSSQDATFITTACPPPGSSIITTIAGNGTPGFAGDEGAASSASLYYPHDVALDSSGNIYIADTFNYRIRKLAIGTGVISTVAGTGTSGFSGDGIFATDTKINGSYGVSVDAAGNIYIADTSNNRIRRVDAATGIISTVAGNGTASFSGDGGPATSASLNNPRKVILDSDGNIYIADTNNNRIRMVDASTGIISTVAGNGSGAFAGDGGSATSASLYWPYSVAADNSGNLYIADYMNMRIRKVEKATGIISTVAGKSGTGLITYTGEGEPATSAQISTPYGVTVDGVGNIFIAASYRILKVDAVTGILNTVAGNGVGGFSGDGGIATTANLNAPSGITIDAAGNLIIADTYNHRIRKVVAPDLTITITASTNGSISGPSNVKYGSSAAYAITPAIGYHVADVLVDGISVGAVTSYTLSKVTANHTISATFAIDTFAITVTAGANGSLSGPATVNYGSNATYTITPTTGFHVTDVLVDGISVGAVTTYNFSSITANHTISATFAIDTFTISATAGANGSLSGSATVNYGSNATYTITPATGYRVSEVIVDGINIGAVTSYLFDNVTSNHMISATFASLPDLVVGSVNGPAIASRGKSIGITSSFKNQGETNAGSFTVSFYISRDRTVTSSDTLLGTRLASQLNAGNTASISGTFIIPRKISSGIYYIGAIADSGNAVTEIIEVNNSRTSENVLYVK